MVTVLAAAAGIAPARGDGSKSRFDHFYDPRTAVGAECIDFCGRRARELGYSGQENFGENLHDRKQPAKALHRNARSQLNLNFCGYKFGYYNHHLVENLVGGLYLSDEEQARRREARARAASHERAAMVTIAMTDARLAGLMGAGKTTRRYRALQCADFRLVDFSSLTPAQFQKLFDLGGPEQFKCSVFEFNYAPGQTPINGAQERMTRFLEREGGVVVYSGNILTGWCSSRWVEMPSWTRIQGTTFGTAHLHGMTPNSVD